MIKLYESGIYLVNGETIVTDPAALPALTGRSAEKDEAERGTMAYGILKAHNTVDDMDHLRLKFDSMTSHDITYVGIIQTARASGMKEFPLPYVLTNCHNSLCAVFSIRHTTRNFPNREGSKPGEGQISAVALMDARSIAATSANGGRLTAATDMDVTYTVPQYSFDGGIYEKRVYNGWTKPEPEHELKFGPNIKDWPEMPALTDDLLVKVCAYITDPVTTTDELIPSGETSSYRSNPERLSEFALSRREPQYVARSKVMRQMERDRRAGKGLSGEVKAVYAALEKAGLRVNPEGTDIGSTIFANMPGDGSAREQAASCQRVMGASANFARAYATKRYRSNCINWGMVPFLVENPEVFELGDYIFVPGVRGHVLANDEKFDAYAVKPDGTVTRFSVSTGALTEAERRIIADGCLINYYKNN